ncbi:DUF342 domain-containing protein [Peribacillus tepidiphilus]|uniref:DUF342 domain-containing protein n=1 Tax=Peribacillus tepidiphilus TaxID=2652445 RepID=UPI0012925377|nr:FapA family protein [Peribacillus tepidiphilus]
MEILQNEHFSIVENGGKIYVIVTKPGYPLILLNKLINQYPRLAVTKFMALKEALENGTGEQVEIGELKPEVECMISRDYMTAKIKLNIIESQLKEHYSEYVSKVLDVLHLNNVREGILVQVLQQELIAGKEILIAKGIEPINGNNAIITYFTCSDRKPTIREDGKADYYDMNFIDEVKKGDWLGEKIPATSGKPGKTVTGELILPKKGKDKKLQYDIKTVTEIEEDGKTVLRALVDGVVEFHNGKIGVGDHLIIEGDVGVETGNIDFKGSITVKGIIKEGFSVTATKDVSIMSEIGISGIKKIESLSGDVFIKGGIFGKGSSVVKAAKNIFVKYSNEAILEAGENINIGYYSVGSTLRAKNIFTDDQKGKLIGGVIEARGKIRTAIIGNQMQRKTILHVQGFDREKLKRDLDDLLNKYREKMLQVEKLKRKLEVFESFLDQLNAVQHSQYIEVKRDFDKIMIEIFQLEDKRKSIMSMLEIKGEGEISIGKIAFPDTMLKIKNFNKRLNESTKGTFYAQNNSLHFE